MNRKQEDEPDFSHDPEMDQGDTTPPHTIGRDPGIELDADIDIDSDSFSPGSQAECSSAPRGNADQPAPAYDQGLDDIEEIGRGGMGAVMFSRDRNLDRRVAKKILLDTGRQGGARP